MIVLIKTLLGDNRTIDVEDLKITVSQLKDRIKTLYHLKGKDFDLAVGWVHDADQTFLNGKKIGETGSFPPDFKGAETKGRYYPAIPSMLKGDGTDAIAWGDPFILCLFRSGPG